MLTLSITSKGQATIPKSVRDRLGVTAPGKITIEFRDADVLLRAPGSPAGMLAAFAKPKTKETAAQAVGRHLGSLDEKTRAH